MVSNVTELSPTDRRLLEQRTAEGVCVAYRDHVLPLGVQPRIGRVGVEVHGRQTLLHVQRGLAYSGPDAEVAGWIQNGTRDFAGIAEAVAWLQSKLGAGTPNGTPTGTGPQATPADQPQRPRSAAPSSVTDLDAVRVPGPPAPPRSADIAAGMHEEVFGQDRAIEALAESAARHLAKAFVRRPQSAVLMGSTGVGKTKSAERLAATLRELTGQAWRCIRLDMSEFSEAHSVSKLTGAPPGYIGYDDPSLATRLADQPRQVVLFDEIEKAHPAVLTTLMNLLDVGRLDSSSGSVTAEKAILLFTSNIGAGQLQPGPDAADDDARGRRALLEHGVRPEIVARFGQVLILGELTGPALAAAAARAVSDTAADYGKEIGRIEPAYISELLHRTQEGRLGVRALEHLVDRELGPLLADCPASLIDVLAGPTRIEPSTTDLV